MSAPSRQGPEREGSAQAPQQTEASAPPQLEAVAVPRTTATPLPEALVRARREYDAGRLDAVIQILQPVLGQLPAGDVSRPAAPAWALLAAAALRTGQPELGRLAATTAEGAFDQLRKQRVELGPDEIADAVRTYYLKDRPQDAVEVARAASAAAQRPEMALYRGLAEHRLKRLDEAVAALEEAEDVKDPQLQQQRLEALAAIFDTFGSSRAQDAALAYHALSRLHYRAIRYAEALAALDRVLPVMPQSAEAHAEKGEILRLQGEFEKALASIAEALRLNPGYAWAHAVQGSTLTGMDRLEGAEAAFKQAITLDGSVADWHYRLGDVLRLRDKLDESLKSLDRALELAPNNVAMHARRGETLRVMARFPDALAALERALELAPEDTFALASKGETLRQMGKEHWAQAEEALQKAVALSPSGYPFAETSLGQLLLDRGRDVEALSIFERVLSANRDHIWALEGQAHALVKLDQMERGLTVARRLTELQPNSGWAYCVSGVCLYNLDDYAAATAALERGTELTAGFDWAHDALAECRMWVARLSKPSEAPKVLEHALEASREALELTPGDLSFRTNLGNVLWMLGDARRREAEAEYRRVVEAARSAEPQEFYLGVAAGWAAFRLAARTKEEESRTLLAEAERFTLEALATKGDRPAAIEAIAAKFSLALMMLCSERFALGHREYASAIELVKQKPEEQERQRRGLLRRAHQLLTEALADWPRLAQSPHASRALGHLSQASSAPITTPSSSR